MNQSDVIAYQLGQNGLTDQIIGNNDYLVGSASYGAAPGADGRLSLGILSLAILGLMGFYVLTHKIQA